LAVFDSFAFFVDSFAIARVGVLVFVARAVDSAASKEARQERIDEIISSMSESVHVLGSWAKRSSRAMMTSRGIRFGERELEG